MAKTNRGVELAKRIADIAVDHLDDPDLPDGQLSVGEFGELLACFVQEEIEGGPLDDDDLEALKTTLKTMANSAIYQANRLPFDPSFC